MCLESSVHSTGLEDKIKLAVQLVENGKEPLMFVHPQEKHHLLNIGLLVGQAAKKQG